MAHVEMYTTPTCPYCHAAKRLLDTRGITYAEFDVATDDALRATIMTRSGRRTVPQIFIDDLPIGGYDELAALDADGTLSALVPHAR